MSTQTEELIMIVSKGIDDELSSAALTIANGSITEGLKVTLFLTSSGVDLVRKRAIELTHVAPLDPLKMLVDSFLERGGRIVACPPCVASRGYVQESLIDGVEITGGSAILLPLKNGAASLCF